MWGRREDAINHNPPQSCHCGDQLTCNLARSQRSLELAPRVISKHAHQFVLFGVRLVLIDSVVRGGVTHVACVVSSI